MPPIEHKVIFTLEEMKLSSTFRRCEVDKPDSTKATNQQLVCSHSRYTAQKLDEIAAAFGYVPTNQGSPRARLIRALALDPAVQVWIPDDYAPSKVQSVYYQEQASSKISPYHYRLMHQECSQVLFDYCRLLGLEFRSKPHPAALLTGIAYGQIILLQLK